MSSYLNIVIPIWTKDNQNTDNKENKTIKSANKKITMLSLSSSSDLYSELSDNLYNIPYGEDNASELTYDDLINIQENIQDEVNNVKNRLAEYEKHAAGNIDIINEILEFKDYLKDKEYVLNYINFLIFTYNNINNEFSKDKYKFYVYKD